MNVKSFSNFGSITAAGLLGLCASNAMGLSVSDLQGQLAKGTKVTVIDVRGTSAFANGHIPGAINIPASLCEQKHLPPLGRVIVYGDGLGHDGVDAAIAALRKKSGVTVEILEGGFAAWQGTHAMTTEGMGMKPEALNYMTYAQLKQANAADVILIDLRKQSPKQSQAAVASGVGSAGSQPLTDLAHEFPGIKIRQSPFDDSAAPSVANKGAGASPLLVLIDAGDGAAEGMARTLKANGQNRYVILAGGELILQRKGQPGLQRSSPEESLPHSAQSTSAITK